jgi:hypothetical protein
LHTYIKVTQGDGCHIKNMLQTLVRGEQSMSARMNIDIEGEGEREKEREREGKNTFPEIHEDSIQIHTLP